MAGESDQTLLAASSSSNAVVEKIARKYVLLLTDY
jgi:hypothetical protein